MTEIEQAADTLIEAVFADPAKAMVELEVLHQRYLQTLRADDSQVDFQVDAQADMVILLRGVARRLIRIRRKEAA